MPTHSRRAVLDGRTMHSGGVEVDIEKVRLAKEEAKARRPNFKIGPYQLKADNVCVWFVDEKGNLAGGYFECVGSALIKSLYRWHMYHNPQVDLSGDVDEFLEKWKVATDQFTRMVREAVEGLK